jgi:hypothetical protein
LPSRFLSADDIHADGIGSQKTLAEIISLENYFDDDIVYSMNTDSDATNKVHPEVSIRAGSRIRTVCAPESVEQRVLSVSEESSLDDLCAALDAADWLLARAKRIERLAKQIAVAWIERNGEFDIGNNHYSVGYSYTVRCLDIPQTANAVLQAAAGDLDRLFDVLVAQPFKHGSVRTVIGRPLHDRLFESRRTAALKSGAPQRDLKRTDQRYLR